MGKINFMNNKHPKGLPYLFFTEMWERFGYYLILGIFVLYLIEPEGMRGGLGLPDKMADDIFGTYIALTYLTPFIGGFFGSLRRMGASGQTKKNCRRSGAEQGLEGSAARELLGKDGIGVW